MAQIGKSVGCAAFFFINWAAIYDIAYAHRTFGLLSISDVWRWYPAALFVGIFVICLLIIWRRFDDKILLRAAFSLAGLLVLLTVVTILTWKDDIPPWHSVSRWIYDRSIFDELGRIAYHTWPIHLTSSIAALFMFLSFRKNRIAARIGASALCALFLFWAWQIVPLGVWPVSILCIGVFLICLFFIWRPLNVKARNSHTGTNS